MSIETIPRLGLGTYSDTDRDRWRDRVEHALEIGYRHIDSAQAYENEVYVGRGLADSDVPRGEVFLTTKTVHPSGIHGPSHEEVIEATEGCLDRLGVEYVDLLYVHWPNGIYDPDVTLPAFDELYDRGSVRHVGVSNFEPDLLDEARNHLNAPLFANQVEMHPLLQQGHLLEYAQAHDLWLVAFCPLAQGAVLEEPVIREVAEKHDATPAQISLAWLLSKDNVVAIPKASSAQHRQENFAARELDLDEADLAAIDEIDREHRVIDREYAPWNR